MVVGRGLHVNTDACVGSQAVRSSKQSGSRILASSFTFDEPVFQPYQKQWHTSMTDWMLQTSLLVILVCLINAAEALLLGPSWCEMVSLVKTCPNGRCCPSHRMLTEQHRSQILIERKAPTFALHASQAGIGYKS